MRPTFVLCLLVAGAVCLAAPALWVAGALDHVEWNNDVLVGSTIVAVALAHVAAGYAFPRWWTPVAVTALWVVVFAGPDVLWVATGWNPLEIPRTDAEGCDPCVPTTFALVGLVPALPLVGVGSALRALDRRWARFS